MFAVQVKNPSMPEPDITNPENGKPKAKPKIPRLVIISLFSTLFVASLLTVLKSL